MAVFLLFRRIPLKLPARGAYSTGMVPDWTSLSFYVDMLWHQLCPPWRSFWYGRYWALSMRYGIIIRKTMSSSLSTAGWADPCFWTTTSECDAAPGDRFGAIRRSHYLRHHN
jgi:hypothetical protein